MRNILDNIYYRIYCFQVSVGNSLVAVDYSLLLLLFLCVINVFSGINFIYAFTGLKILKDNPIIIGLSIFIFCFLLIFFLFIYQNRYKEIIKKNKRKRKLIFKENNLKVIMFMVATLILLGLSFYLMILRNKGIFT